MILGNLRNPFFNCDSRHGNIKSDTKRARNHYAFSTTKATKHVSFTHYHFIDLHYFPGKSNCNLWLAMAAAIGFSRFISGQCLSSKERSKQTISITPVSKTILRPVKIKTGPQIYTKRATKRKPHKLYVAPRSSLNFDTSSFSPAETIMQFYSYINEKNLTQLEKLIAEDCYFEDYSFPKPFQGKKVSSFYSEDLKQVLDFKHCNNYFSCMLYRK